MHGNTPIHAGSHHSPTYHRLSSSDLTQTMKNSSLMNDPNDIIAENQAEDEEDLRI
jgi:hypothetical protein